MPVKIITGSTDNSQGVINVDDLGKIKSHFVDQTDLVRKEGKPVHKTWYCLLYKQQVEDLFVMNGHAPVLKINFSLHLNGTKESCDGKDISNSLTVVIESADDTPDLQSHTNVGDFVLIPGYTKGTSLAKLDADAPCCPSSHP